MVQRMTLPIFDSLAKLEGKSWTLSYSFLVNESDTVNPFISPSDKENVKEEMNMIEVETDKEIIMQIFSFFSHLSWVNTSNL